ncbi:predicted protein [Chaetoceros tenuissimus]|uniref:F-box domain-containing protein n=1 Tax=Chaetoceros tenuissimus TaxID=426638 RepID=A0AAD3DBC1_9STRA|nr:predicted protein [Chaetoceros tenuissimus]
MNNHISNKKQKTIDAPTSSPTASSPTSNQLFLPEDLLVHCLEFLNPNEYFFLGAVNKFIRMCYLKLRGDPSGKITSVKALLESESRFVCFTDFASSLPTGEQREELEFLSAAIMQEAVVENKVFAVDYLLRCLTKIDSFQDVKEMMLCCASTNASIDILQLFVDKGWKSNKEEVSMAAVNSQNLDVVRFVIDNGFPFGEQTVFEVIKSGNLRILEYFLEEKEVKCGDEEVLFALVTQQFESIRYMLNKGASYTPTLLAHFALIAEIQIPQDLEYIVGRTEVELG